MSIESSKTKTAVWRRWVKAAATKTTAVYDSIFPTPVPTDGYVFTADGSGGVAWEGLAPSTPAGVLSNYAGAAAPTGYLECDGSAISRTTYAGLFTAISTMYGVGDGSTTFNLPDLRGLFIRGFNNGAGTDPDAAIRAARGDGTTGDNVGTYQSFAMQNLTGTFGFTDNNATYFRVRVQNASGIFGSQQISTNYLNSSGTPGATTLPGNVNFDASRQAQTSSEVRPRNIQMMYIIKT